MAPRTAPTTVNSRNACEIHVTRAKCGRRKFFPNFPAVCSPVTFFHAVSSIIRQTDRQTERTELIFAVGDLSVCWLGRRSEDSMIVSIFTDNHRTHLESLGVSLRESEELQARETDEANKQTFARIQRMQIVRDSTVSHDRDERERECTSVARIARIATCNVKAQSCDSRRCRRIFPGAEGKSRLVGDSSKMLHIAVT